VCGKIFVKFNPSRQAWTKKKSGLEWETKTTVGKGRRKKRGRQRKIQRLKQHVILKVTPIVEPLVLLLVKRGWYWKKKETRVKGGKWMLGKGRKKLTRKERKNGGMDASDQSNKYHKLIVTSITKGKGHTIFHLWDEGYKIKA